MCFLEWGSVALPCDEGGGVCVAVGEGVLGVVVEEAFSVGASAGASAGLVVSGDVDWAIEAGGDGCGRAVLGAATDKVLLGMNRDSRSTRK